MVKSDSNQDSTDANSSHSEVAGKSGAIENKLSGREIQSKQEELAALRDAMLSGDYTPSKPDRGDAGDDNENLETNDVGDEGVTDETDDHDNFEAEDDGDDSVESEYDDDSEEEYEEETEESDDDDNDEDDDPDNELTDIDPEKAQEMLEEGRQKVGGKPRRKPQDEVEEFALKVLQHQPAFRDMKLKDILVKAEEILGVKDDSVGDDQEGDDSGTDDDSVESEQQDSFEFETADAMIAKSDELFEQAEELEAEAFRLAADLETEEAEEKHREAAQLRRESRRLEREADKFAEQEFEKIEAYNQSEERVIEMRPDAADQNSLYATKMREKSLEMRLNGDKRLKDPRLPEILMMLVDKDLGIEGSKKVAKTSTQPRTNPPRKAGERSVQNRRKAAPAPASGSARRGSRKPNQTVSDLKAKHRTPEEWEAMKEQMMGG